MTINKIVSGRMAVPVLINLLFLLTACATTSEEVLGSATGPALATDVSDVGPGGIDASRVNQGPRTSEEIGFVGVIKGEKKDITISAEELKQNLTEIRGAGAKKIDLDSPVTISFNNDPLSYVVKQLLGGLLSANYVMADDVSGTVSFKTETPVPRSAIPSIVRDMLARGGYVMKLINGVYQIGKADVIAALEHNSATGVAGDYVTKLITLKRGNINEIANVVAQILPPNASVTVLESSNALMLHFNPTDEKSVLDMVNALIDNGGGDDLVSVIPLRESAPEVVAASINSYFSNSSGSARNVPFIIPLEQQQSLLVVAHDERVMENVRTLVRGLDKDNRDAPSLRIIPLKYLSADEISGQLNKIFDTHGSTSDTPPPPENPVKVSLNTGIPSDGGGLGENGENFVAPPAIAKSPNEKTSRNLPTVGGDAQAKNVAPEATAQTDESVSIVPDPRSNALLVHSNFRQFKRIRDVVDALDLPPAQVVIEATIVEVKLNDALKFGVEAFLRGQGLNIRSSRQPDPTDTGEAGGVLSFELNALGDTATVVLQALQTVTDLKIISSPYLTVLDGHAAKLSVGDQIPYLVQQTNASDTGTTTTTNQIEIRDVGIILNVTPNIRPDNSVVLDVKQEVSSAQATGSGDTLTPVIAQRAIDSAISVDTGKTVLLGGLYQNRSEKLTTGVPGLSKLPVLGKLFKQTDNTAERTELLVMITPRVIRTSSQLDVITRQLRARSFAGN